MGHYLSEMESPEEDERKRARQDEVSDRYEAGFRMFNEFSDHSVCLSCGGVVLSAMWRRHAGVCRGRESR